MTQCECNGPGWCERHKCTKTEHFYKLCKNSEAYFQQYEQGKGPGQRVQIDNNVTEVKGPNIFDKVINLGKAVVNHVKDGLQKVPEQVQTDRLTICQGCPESGIPVCEYYENGTCGACGCILAIKTKWASEKCPIDKWGKWEPSQEASAVTQPKKSGCGCGKSV